MGGRSERRDGWVRRAPWWMAILAMVAGAATTGTTGLASSLPLTSAKLTMLRTCVLTGYPNTSTAVVDAEVRQSSATSNFGTAVSTFVATASGSNRRTYVKFDLSRCSPAIPTTATVKTATLRVYGSTLPLACRSNDLFKVTATWAEGTVTWNNQPFGTTLNNPPQAQRSAVANLGAAPCALTIVGYTTWTVTADVQGFATTPATNFGWMIRDDVESAATARTATYATKNASVLSTSPQLVVNYR